jgi:hypothetical protein
MSCRESGNNERFREAHGAGERFDDVAEELRQARPFLADPRIYIPSARRRSARAADVRREGCGGPVIEFVSGEGGGQPDNSDGFAHNPEPRIISVTFGEPKLTPVRGVISRSRSCPTGKYPSWKMRRMMQWESPAELKAFRLLDCDANITAFVEQPCKIVYFSGVELKGHVPDVHVEFCEHKELWEIKIDGSDPDVIARTILLSNGLKQHGFFYRLVLDSELEAQPRLQNANTLLRYGRRPLEELDRERLRLLLKKRGSLTWVDASSGAYGPLGRDALCRLALEGILRVDMDKPLTADTQFSCLKGEL